MKPDIKETAVGVSQQRQNNSVGESDTTNSSC